MARSAMPSIRGRVGDAYEITSPALLAHHRDAAGAVAQGAQAGDVVGVQVRVHRLHQPQVELGQELDVARDLVEHGVDDQRLAAAPAGQEIGVGAGDGVEHLAEDHSLPSRAKAHRLGS
jgi:hypothetical protein